MTTATMKIERAEESNNQLLGGGTRSTSNGGVDDKGVDEATKFFRARNELDVDETILPYTKVSGHAPQTSFHTIRMHILVNKGVDKE